MYDRRGERKYLSWPEREAFFRAVKDEPDPLKRTFCLTLVYTGCRLSEALNLLWERVDFAEQCLTFQTLKRRTDRHFRSVPVPDRLLKELKRFAGCEQPGRRVFPWPRNTRKRLAISTQNTSHCLVLKMCRM